jgi:putative transposase
MTRYDPAVHHRQSIRLRNYDYRQAGAYFVTLCTQGREPAFGEIVADTMHLNAYGAMVAEDWTALATQFGYVDLDTFVVMPNHLHGIIVVTDPLTDARAREGDSSIAPTSPSPPVPTQKRLPIGRIVGTFKTRSTKHVNEWRETPGAPLWQPQLLRTRYPRRRRSGTHSRIHRRESRPLDAG